MNNKTTERAQEGLDGLPWVSCGHLPHHLSFRWSGGKTFHARLVIRPLPSLSLSGFDLTFHYLFIYIYLFIDVFSFWLGRVSLSMVLLSYGRPPRKMGTWPHPRARSKVTLHAPLALSLSLNINILFIYYFYFVVDFLFFFIFDLLQYPRLVQFPVE